MREIGIGLSFWPFDWGWYLSGIESDARRGKFCVHVGPFWAFLDLPARWFS